MSSLAVLAISAAAAADPFLLRKAYHRALLAAHPDKSSASDSNFTVDQVRQAYLSLLADQVRETADGGGSIGYSVIDLDDFVCSGDEKNTYWHPCRCGHGFSVTDDDLENDRDIVGCEGCSLLVRVAYEAAAA